MSELSHLDAHGAARMVDVSEKDATAREAQAEAVIALSARAFEAVAGGTAPKGDVLAAARLAGIMAAKKTSELIPLCHPVALTKAAVDIEAIPERSAFRIVATAKTTGQTGVEMEALTAAAIAALTIYDMTKAVDRAANIECVRLLMKSGGKSGTYAASASSRERPAPKARAKTRAAPTVLAQPVAAPAAAAGPGAQRESLRAFMIDRHLRATEWARQAGVPAAQIYAFLTGRSRALPQDTAERLARAANARVEDLLGRAPLTAR